MRVLLFAALVLAPVAGVAKTHVVTIGQVAFAPKVLEVKSGDTVVWKNEDMFVHNVRAQDSSFGSKDLEPKQSFRWKAAKKGHHPYRCTLHPIMVGTLVVN